MFGRIWLQQLFRPSYRCPAQFNISVCMFSGKNCVAGRTVPPSRPDCCPDPRTVPGHNMDCPLTAQSTAVHRCPPLSTAVHRSTAPLSSQIFLPFTVFCSRRRDFLCERAGGGGPDPLRGHRDVQGDEAGLDTGDAGAAGGPEAARPRGGVAAGPGPACPGCPAA